MILSAKSNVNYHMTTTNKWTTTQGESFNKPTCKYSEEVNP